jgi:hypothetical protein
MSALTAIATPLIAGLQLAGGIQGKRDADKWSDLYLQLGAEQKRAMALQSEKLYGEIVSSYAANNINPWRGSPVDVLADAAINEALNADKAEFGYEMRAARATTEGLANLMSGVSGAFSTIVGGVAAWGQRPKNLETGFYEGADPWEKFFTGEGTTGDFSPAVAAPEVFG